MNKYLSAKFRDKLIQNISDFPDSWMQLRLTSDNSTPASPEDGIVSNGQIDVFVHTNEILYKGELIKLKQEDIREITEFCFELCYSQTFRPDIINLRSATESL